MCILRGFLKGTYFRSVGRPNSTFSTEWPINRGLAVEMTLRGRDDGASATTSLHALGAWKPAKDAGFHIPTATATAAVKLGQTAKPPPIVHFYRFSCRTEQRGLPASRVAVESIGPEEPASISDSRLATRTGPLPHLNA